MSSDSAAVEVQGEETPLLGESRTASRIRDHLNRWGDCRAEFYGTGLFVALGLSVNAALLTNPAITSTAAAVLGALGWGIALMVGMAVAAPISGGHVNPAITLGFVLRRQISWGKAIGYMVAQYLGAFVGAALTHLLFLQSMHRREDTGADNLDIFASFSSAHVNQLTAFLCELTGAGVLTVVVANFARASSSDANKAWMPFATGLAFTALVIIFGHQTGGMFNPARDFGPRVYTLVAGWGFQAFSARHLYFWVPLVAPFFGAVLGMLEFVLFLT
ncbi:hypothetical protein IWQ62_003639 [Dispira parvispora]|uniref:Aquaporin n=1 Tax=Dispira parvispora TaxID=1520584 RepID=A0A9W8AP02_9FUNG|nr:hypothetical protein IWQ62_003639 [Dispira parvispora]